MNSMEQINLPDDSSSMSKDLETDLKIMAFYTECLSILAENNYSGELREKIHQIQAEIESMDFGPSLKSQIEQKLGYISQIALFDETPHPMKRVRAHLKDLKKTLNKHCRN